MIARGSSGGRAPGLTHALACAALVGAALAPLRAEAAEITVLCPRPLQHVVAAAAQEFQRRTRHTVWLSYGTSAAIASRAATDEADVVVASERDLAELEARGVVRRESRVSVGRVGLGIAVRASAAAPDISSERALRRAILQATSLGYADPAGGGQAAQVAQVLESLGVGALVLPKTSVYADGLRTLDALAKDKVALAILPVSEIVGGDGVKLVGPLPEPVQQTLAYAGGVLARSPAADVARAFLAHLGTAEMRDLLKAGGVDSGE